MAPRKVQGLQHLLSGWGFNTRLPDQMLDGPELSKGRFNFALDQVAHRP